MQPGKREIRALTGVRALAAIWVVLFHLRIELQAMFPDAPGWIDVAMTSGYLGVDLFFILSGFIISYNYADWFTTAAWRPYVTFLWARLARLYPVHLFTMALMVTFYFTMEGLLGFGVHYPERYTFGTLLENVLLTHSWALPVGKSWNVPSWSISAEWAAYLLFPVVLAIAKQLDRTAAILAAIPILLLGPTVVYMMTDYYGTMSYGLLRIGAEFSIGCLLFRLYRKGVGQRLPWGLLTLASLAIVVILGGVSRKQGFEPFTWAPLFLALIVYGLAWERGPMARILRTPSLVYWGRVSYSLYMVHAAVLVPFRNFFTPTVFAAGDMAARIFLLLALAGTIAFLAVAVYHGVERPGQAALRRLWPLSLARPVPVPAGG